MNLPFFYPQHPEFKAHVEYVRVELNRFIADSRLYEWPAEERVAESESRAKDIVLWVSKKPVREWHDFKIWSFGYFIGGAVVVMGILILQALKAQ